MAFHFSYVERGFFIIFLLFTCFEVHAQGRFEYTHQQMGTQIRLVFYTTSNGKADSMANLAFKRIDDLNYKLSDYKQNSELNKLCRQANEDVAVSNDLYRILNESVRISEDTNGAFDVTAGTLIQLWRKTRKTRILPSKSQLNKAKKKVGFEHISFRDSNTIKLNKKGMQLDLGGIGKGFTADEVIKLLHINGVTSALVDMGGDICVSDPPPHKENWLLAFSYYNGEGEEVVKRIKLNNSAVATSGDLFQFVEIDGQRYSHIVNPITGIALRNNTQVTVIAKTATEADAYASAISVLGVGQTQTLMGDLDNIHAFIVEGSLNNYRSWASSVFNSFFDEQ